MARRSAASVSPVRTAVRNPRDKEIPSPPTAAEFRPEALGSFWMSLESAFSGDTYTTSVCASSRPSIAFRNRASMQIRKAASVLPTPCRRRNQRWLARENMRPPLLLRFRGGTKATEKPFADDRMCPPQIRMEKSGPRSSVGEADRRGH